MTYYNNEYSNNEGNITMEENIKKGKLTPVKIGIVKIDYFKNFNPKVGWKSGIKASFSDLLNNVKAYSLKDNKWTIDTNLIN